MASEELCPENWAVCQDFDSNLPREQLQVIQAQECRLRRPHLRHTDGGQQQFRQITCPECSTVWNEIVDVRGEFALRNARHQSNDLALIKMVLFIMKVVLTSPFFIIKKVITFNYKLLTMTKRQFKIFIGILVLLILEAILLLIIISSLRSSFK